MAIVESPTASRTQHGTLAAWPRILLHCTAALGAALLLAAAASVKIALPFTPVPITLQTLVLFLGAALLQRHYAIQMVAWYLGLGIAGAPFFAGGTSGLLAMAGPTGGYLIGFLVAAAWIGHWQHRVTGFATQWMLFFTASLWLFGCGLIWLGLVTDSTPMQTITLGFTPFIPGDIIKITLASAALIPRNRRKSLSTRGFPS